jgi:hypothetical protein
MEPARRDDLIERYRNAEQAIAVAIDHVAPYEMDVRIDPDGWSVREVIHYLADSQLLQSVRLRRMLTENRPVLTPWDKAHYSERLHYARPIETAVALFRGAVEDDIELLRTLTDDQWKREGNQQKPWLLTVESWLEENVVRLRGHLLEVMNAHSGGRVIPDPDSK